MIKHDTVKVVGGIIDWSEMDAIVDLVHHELSTRICAQSSELPKDAHLIFRLKIYVAMGS